MLNTLERIAHDAEGVTSIEAALKAHNLDWTVSRRPTYFMDGNRQPQLVPSRFAIVRDDLQIPLGSVGPDYVPLSNIDALQHVNKLVETGAAVMDSVFSMKGGRRVGASLKLTDQISIGGQDPIDMYAIISTTHDTSGTIKTQLIPIRLFCTNQLNLISKTARQSWSVRHLSTMRANLDVVEKELQEMANYAKWLQKTGDRLIEEALNEMQLSDILLKALHVTTDDDKKKTKIVTDIVDVFKYSDKIGEDFKNTKWGGLNAVTEYFDHHREYRTPQARYNAITGGLGARTMNAVASSLLV
jgi:phage/plasmid-like protein (TIGR03299 family)